jgi:ribokinase
MPQKKVRIVVLGSIFYDCVVWADRLPKKGETVVGYKNGFFCGGKGANQAVQAAKLGAEVYMISKVGRDNEGEILLNNLRENGVNTDYVKIDENYKTDICCINVDKNGDNTLVIVPDASKSLQPEDVLCAEEILKTADIFLTQLEINPEVVEFALRLAKKWDRKTVLNPAPPRDIPVGLFKYADYITPNIENNKDLSTWCDEVGKKLLGLGSKSMIITLGKKGAYFTDGTRCSILPTFDVVPVDTTAAGDAFNAALSVKLGEGATIEEALKYANAAGSLAASKEGAQASLSTREEVEALIKNDVLLGAGEELI